MIDKRQVEAEYDRYAKMMEFAGKKVPMFEEYLLQRGLKLEDYLNEEELIDAKRNFLFQRS